MLILDFLQIIFCGQMCTYMLLMGHENMVKQQQQQVGQAFEMFLLLRFCCENQNFILCVQCSFMKTNNSKSGFCQKISDEDSHKEEKNSLESHTCHVCLIPMHERINLNKDDTHWHDFFKPFYGQYPLSKYAFCNCT